TLYNNGGTLYWNGSAVGGGNYIQNQIAADQDAQFRISKSISSGYVAQISANFTDFPAANPSVLSIRIPASADYPDGYGVDSYGWWVKWALTGNSSWGGGVRGQSHGRSSSESCGVYGELYDNTYSAAAGAAGVKGMYNKGTTATGSLGYWDGAAAWAGYFSGNVRVTGAFYDSSGDVGGAGQVLSSTGAGTDWVAAGAGSCLWTDAGTYIYPSANSSIQAYDEGQTYGLYYGGGNTYGMYGNTSSGTVGAAGVYGRYGPATVGSGYGTAQSMAGVKGYNFYGTSYHFGVAGYCYDDHSSYPYGGVFGAATVSDNPTVWGALGFHDASGTEWAGYFTGNTYTTGTHRIGAYTLPSTDGLASQVLQTNGSGTVSWATVSGGSLPAGSEGRLMYYNDPTGWQATSSSLSWNDTTSVLAVNSFEITGGDIWHNSELDLVAYHETASPVGTNRAFGVYTGTGIANLLTILNNGSVGIGTASPTSAFEVRGKINACGDGAGTLTPSGVGAIYAASGTVSGGWGGLGTINSMMVGNGGSCAYYSWTWAGDSTGMYFDHQSTGDAIRVNDSGTVSFVIKDGGNVGIGTSSPSNRLHVEGTAGGSAGIYLNSAVPSSTASTLYNNGGTLYWNGSAVGGGGSSLWTDNTSYINPNTTGTVTCRIYDTGQPYGLYLTNSPYASGPVYGVCSELNRTTDLGTDYWNVGGFFYAHHEIMFEDQGQMIGVYADGRAGDLTSHQNYWSDGLGISAYGYARGGLAYGIYAKGEADGTNSSFAQAYGGYFEGDAATSATGGVNAYGVYASAVAGANQTTYGIYATASGGTTNYAGYFNGNVYITGSITKGSGSFLIDHPLDPMNKTLRHNFVESPENLCLYRGKVRLDENGTAMVDMPAYFPALTKEEEATVTLTPVGRNPFVVSYEWNESCTGFAVYGSPNCEVSYQVLADRDDPAMRKLRKPVEEEKGNGNFEKGQLLYSDAYGCAVTGEAGK
ncbi:MAG: hypothetical protein RDV41_04905, partial [Planctomycetota bacterium]|nr:hypothetical protein [Planctomycetota bacterium]